jgi:alkaline phosphatase D
MRSAVVFRHAVASGDPLEDRVVIWTRVTTDITAPEVRWTLARDRRFAEVIAEGAVTADVGRDHTVSVDVDGLDPAAHYWYRFDALGERSPVGRTKTLPAAESGHLRFAMVSCAKLNAGWFNAYARIADRDDLDFLLHLGDYIYEASQTPPATQTASADIGRPFDPLHECVTLADYRRRYAQYHRDPDVQRMHLAHPMIGTVDDHEFADGAWSDGAIEHVPERDGPWAERRAACFRARTEWLPVRLPDPADPERVWRAVPLGDLADLILLDTRTRRDEPAQTDDAVRDPERTQLGHEQREWLLRELAASRATWRLIANSSIMGHAWDPRLPESAHDVFVRLKLVSPDAAGPDGDQWDGYPHERDAILRALGDHPVGSAVVLSGDIHVGVALELHADPLADEPPIAVEFVTPSLTSQNVDEKLGWEPRTTCVEVERAVMEALPHIKWCDFESHGYVVVDVTRDRVRAEWWLVDTVTAPSYVESAGAAFEVRSGEARLRPA